MFEKLLQIVKDKATIDKRLHWYKGSITYFEGLKDETLEVEEEITDNNKVHLEDELGDVLWAYFNLIEGLKSEGKIDSLESIIKRSEKKFGERISAIKKGKNEDETFELWNKVKAKQKAENKAEHDKLYS